MLRSLYCFILVVSLSTQSLQAQVNRKDTNKAYPVERKDVATKYKGKAAYMDIGKEFKLMKEDIIGLRNEVLHAAGGVDVSEIEDADWETFDCVLACTYKMEKYCDQYYDEYLVLGLLYDIEDTELMRELYLLEKRIRESEMFNDETCGCLKGYDY